MGQGNRVFWKAWNSWLEHKCGPGEQEYTEFSALAWIVIPWKLEQSLLLVPELIPWIAGAAHTGKSDYFGLPSPKTKELSAEKLCRFATTALKTFQDFSTFLQWLLDFVSHHIQIKTLGIVPVLSFFHGKSKHEFGTRDQVAAAVFPTKAELLFNSQPINKSDFGHCKTWPLPEVGTMEILECSQCVPGWICHLLSSWLQCAACFFLVLLFL